MNATITNQCAAPTTLHLSIRVWPSVSVSMRGRGWARSPRRPGSGWPSRMTDDHLQHRADGEHDGDERDQAGDGRTDDLDGAHAQASGGLAEPLEVNGTSVVTRR